MVYSEFVAKINSGEVVQFKTRAFIDCYNEDFNANLPVVEKEVRRWDEDTGKSKRMTIYETQITT